MIAQVINGQHKGTKDKPVLVFISKELANGNCVVNYGKFDKVDKFIIHKNDLKEWSIKFIKLNNKTGLEMQLRSQDV